MKIGILSRNRTLYSTRRLEQAARRRGHRVRVLDTMQVARLMGIAYRRPSNGRPRRIPKVDGIIPRIGASITRYGVAVVRDFEARGAVTTASAEAIAHSRNKLQSLQLMVEAEFPVPRTELVSHPDQLGAAIDMVGGPPVVLKILKGTQGRGVILAPNLKIAQAVVILLLRHGQQQLLVQEFIEEAEGKDLRLLVVGRRCVAAMERIAPEDDFRANLHRGATATAVQPDEESARLAVQAAGLHGIGVAGVDIIPSERGPLLLEVNSSPGLEGIERTTRVDVAGRIVHFLEQEARRSR
jgi:ribosomal protein S6--L-glutamate ligase